MVEEEWGWWRMNGGGGDEWGWWRMNGGDGG